MLVLKKTHEGDLAALRAYIAELHHMIVTHNQLHESQIEDLYNRIKDLEGIHFNPPKKKATVKRKSKSTK